MTTDQLDDILVLQLAIAWAGESDTDPRRLGWWRTGMCDEYGGQDLLKRLAPKTWEWAALESARAAAKRVDNRARNQAEDPDHLLTLYRLGFEVDEQLDERLLEIKQNGVSPSTALPKLGEICASWSADRLTGWLGELGESGYTATATGRRLKGNAPNDLCEVAIKLAAALLPLDSDYVLPHFRISR
jgi:hypothetical protein